MMNIFLSILALFIGLSSSAFAEEQQLVDFAVVITELENAGEAALIKYDPADGEETGDAFSDIYFDIFEDSGMEMAVGLADPERKTYLESLFAQIIGKANKGAPRQKVIASWNLLIGELATTAAAQNTESSGFWGVAVQSFLILLREGFEAILVVTALIAYLKRSGNEGRVRYIWQGVCIALIASIATAWLMKAAIKVSGEEQEALEGVTMLIASLVLFYVSFWLLAKSQAGRWQAYVRGRIDRALAGNKVFALAFAAFLAVYREGAETVLFYQALLAGNEGKGAAIASGFAGATLALGVIYWIMRYASLKLPLGLFFTATATLLYYLSIVFAGKGILELQEAKWISITPVDGVPSIIWLGLFPTVETMAAQAVLLVPLPIIWWWWARKRTNFAARIKAQL